MRYPACLPLCALLLAGCAESPPPPLANYHAAQGIAPLQLVFAHGETGVPVFERPELRALTGRIPASTVPVLLGNDSLLSARAASVGALLRRPVRPVLAPDTPPDQAVLSVAIPPAIVADACLRPGGLLEDGTWPGQDDNPIRLLPPGCATATDIAAQTARPADLLLGRPLPPAPMPRPSSATTAATSLRSRVPSRHPRVGLARGRGRTSRRWCRKAG